MSDILLTDSEIEALMRGMPIGSTIVNTVKRVTKAQLARVFEWGEEDCPHVSHSRGKHWCGECWDSLKRGEE